VTDGFESEACIRASHDDGFSSEVFGGLGEGGDELGVKEMREKGYSFAHGEEEVDN